MEEWTLIAGLGNPGERYEKTRHNAGFLVLERLATRLGAGWKTESKFQCQLARGELSGQRVLLCKPQTFMNLSGDSVGPLMQFYRVPVTRVLVVVDDADLATGTIRLKSKGSSGGHHGLDSIQQQMETVEYARQRIGIGRQDAQRREITGHVLGRFAEDEWPLMTEVFGRACEQIESWLRHGIEKAMNQYNGPVTPPEDQKKERL